MREPLRLRIRFAPTGLAALLLLLAGALPAGAAEPRVLPPSTVTQAPPSTAGPVPDRISTTAAHPPDRTILEWLADGPSGQTTRLSLFSNRTVVLKSTQKGAERVEHRILGEEELAVYEQLIDGLFADAGPGGSSTVGCDGRLIEHTVTRMTAKDGTFWQWSECGLGSRPLAATALLAAAMDLAESVREKRRIDDPWKQSFPAVGDRLLREDGLVFEVTAIDEFTDRVDLRSLTQPLSMRMRREELHWHFVLEKEEKVFRSIPQDVPPSFP